MPIQLFPPILSSSPWMHRAPTRRLLPPMSRDTGRAAADRAGSFNSGKNRSRSNYDLHHSISLIIVQAAFFPRLRIKLHGSADGK